MATPRAAEKIASAALFRAGARYSIKATNGGKIIARLNWDPIASARETRLSRKTTRGNASIRYHKGECSASNTGGRTGRSPATCLEANGVPARAPPRHCDNPSCTRVYSPGETSAGDSCAISHPHSATNASSSAPARICGLPNRSRVKNPLINQEDSSIMSPYQRECDERSRSQSLNQPTTRKPDKYFRRRTHSRPISSDHYKSLHRARWVALRLAVRNLFDCFWCAAQRNSVHSQACSSLFIPKSGLTIMAVSVW